MEALINGVKVPNSLLNELKETNLKNTTDAVSYTHLTLPTTERV